MKIYQLYEYSYDWEDSMDYIRGSYLKKERAEEELVKAKSKEEESRSKNDKCQQCPFVGEEQCELDTLLSTYHDYCSDMKLYEDADHCLDCENYYFQWGYSTFGIKEVEVEE